MNYTLYELTWYFFLYSFLGWCLEIVYAAVRKKKFLNRGVLNQPLCPVYGLGMIFGMIFFDSLRDSFIFLAAGCAIMATVLEFFTGLLMERLFKKRWWDYSDYQFNLGGYVCLPFSAVWGSLAALAIIFIHPLTNTLLRLIPKIPGHIILFVWIFFLILDFCSVLGVIFHVRRRNKQLAELAGDMQQFSNRLERMIILRVERRMVKAHPVLVAPSEEPELKAASAGVFAQGCGFYKLVWLFFISAFLGDLTETVFCYITSGVLMSRSSVVYGPFSIVWGLGVVVLSIMLYRYQDRSDRYIFLFGTAVGGAYEYICSVFTELAFGTVFWDYSNIPFNLGGRINLLYCFFWGIAAVIWIKFLYPVLSGLIEKIPPKTGKILTWCIVLFMTFNILISAAALIRYSERQSKNNAQLPIEQFLDKHYPDSRMQHIYPNAIIKK